MVKRALEFTSSMGGSSPSIHQRSLGRVKDDRIDVPDGKAMVTSNLTIDQALDIAMAIAQENHGA